jgi:hypothetical protein
VVELLPERAAAKLRALRQRSADAHAVTPPFEQVRQASMDKIAAQNALKRLTDPAQDFGFHLGLDDLRVITAQKHLDKITADFVRLQELQRARIAQWETASAALSNTEGCLRHGRPSGVQLLDTMNRS